MCPSRQLLFLSNGLEARCPNRPIPALASLSSSIRLFGSIPSLVDTDGTPISDASVSDRLRGKRAALYFAAGWCPMCTSFEPSLLQFRQAAADSGKDVELIYVGSDRSREDASIRASNLGMLSVPFDDADDVKRSYKVWSGPESLRLGFGRRSGVPALVVLDGSGEEMAFVPAEAEGAGALASWPLDDERGVWN